MPPGIPGGRARAPVDAAIEVHILPLHGHAQRIVGEAFL